MKKIISLMMAMAMVLSMGAMSFADVTTAGGTGDTTVKLDVAAASFSVTVPTTITYAVASDGTVTAPSNVKIVNNSHGAVKVANVAVAGISDWEIKGFDAYIPADSKIGAHEAAITINDCKTTADDTIAFDASKFQVMTGAAGTDNECELTFGGKFAPQKTASQSDVITVTFTVAWDE